MRPTFFATPLEFRAWLEKHHDTSRELVVGYYKKSCGKPSITWPKSVDEALCFGWIDGVRKSMSAKKEETRRRRLAALIDDSAHGRTVRPLTPPSKPR